MLPLRFAWLWGAAGWLLLAAVIVGSLLPAPLLARVGVGVSDKIIHASMYGFLMLWFAGLYARRSQLRIAGVLFAVGVAIEIAQSLTTTRAFELADIAANGSGILAALVPSVWLLAGWCQWFERRVLAVAS